MLHRAPCASNGPEHLGLRALQFTELTNGVRDTKRECAESITSIDKRLSDAARAAADEVLEKVDGLARTCT